MTIHLFEMRCNFFSSAFIITHSEMMMKHDVFLDCVSPFGFGSMYQPTDLVGHPSSMSLSVSQDMILFAKLCESMSNAVKLGLPNSI